MIQIMETNLAVVFEDGITPVSFSVYFRPCLETILQKDCRFQRDSNSDRRRRWQAR